MSTALEVYIGVSAVIVVYIGCLAYGGSKCGSDFLCAVLDAFT